MKRAALLLTGVTVGFLFGRPPKRSRRKRASASARRLRLSEETSTPRSFRTFVTPRPSISPAAPVPGYGAPECVLLREVAVALKEVQDELRAKNLGLKVYDCYRPRRAVSAFVDWVKKPNSKGDESHYPNTSRADLLKLGYISAVSSHSYGTAVDLTLIALSAEPSRAELGKSSWPLRRSQGRARARRESGHGNRLRLLRQATVATRRSSTRRRPKPRRRRRRATVRRSPQKDLALRDQKPEKTWRRLAPFLSRWRSTKTSAIGDCSCSSS